MDIATLLESHRRHYMELVENNSPRTPTPEEMNAVASLHDRATTRTLLDLYRSGVTANGQQPVGQAALTTPIPTPSRRVRAGSKKARERALKAGETRRKNLELRRREEIEKDSGAQDSPAAVGGAA